MNIGTVNRMITARINELQALKNKMYEDECWAEGNAAVQMIGELKWALQLVNQIEQENEKNDKRRDIRANQCGFGNMQERFEKSNI